MVIGNIQKRVLQAMSYHGDQWANKGSNSGWVWGSTYETERIMKSLCKKGLVKYEDGYYKKVVDKY